MNFNYLQLKKETEIINWLNKYNIENYTLIPNEECGFLINVEGNVNLGNQKILDYLPVKFNIVTGVFDISNNYLLSLEGSPVEAGVFICSSNNLTMLEHCPKIIKKSFYCNNNKLKTLKGCPKDIGGNFAISINNLEDLEFCPQSVGGTFSFDANPIKNYIYFPQKIGNSVFSHDEKIYDFEEIFRIHLKDKADYEKKFINENLNIDNNKKNSKESFKL